MAVHFRLMPNLAKLKICFMAGTLGQGGAERQLYYILRALRQSGANLRLLTLTQGEFWERRILELGVPVSYVGQETSKLARVSRIVKELKTHLPDIVQSQHFYTNLYVVAAARALGLREVGAMRNDGTHEIKATGRVVGSLSLRAPRMIAANSRGAIRTAIRLGVPPARLQLLPNVVDTDHFRPGPRKELAPVRIVGVGRMVAQKRFDRFLSVVAQVQKHAPNMTKTLLVGEGEERVKLEQQARSLGLLPETLEFRGNVTDTAALYRAADLLLLTSDHEGTPNVVMEAMACGLPVVATRVGGVPEILQNGESGFLCDPADQDGLTNAVLKLIANPGLRTKMGAAARAFIEAHHSPQRLPEFLVGLYKTALA
jgi:glycosyltransferase involved in cell wall biosynthesis